MPGYRLTWPADPVGNTERMGEMIFVSCPQCDVSFTEFNGVGMMGTGTALVVCRSCERFVRKRLRLQESDQGDEFRCPYCRRVAIDIMAEPPVPCPTAGTDL